MSFFSLANFITNKTQSLSNYANSSLPGVFGNIAADIINNVGNDIASQASKFTSQITVGSNQTLATLLSDPLSAISSFAFSGAPGLIDTSGSGTGNQGSLQPNTLHKYASFNTIFTLGALSADELNFPDSSYQTNEVPRVIIKSGGGAGASKVTTPFESKGRVEYFIDDVEIESIIAPGSANGISSAISVNFTVFEPYSLGMFLQTIKVACRDAGHENHVGAPFLLKMDFIGWDDNGNSFNAENSSRMIPIFITHMNISVTESGSVYTIEAVSANAEAMFDEIQTIKNDVSITGIDVIGCLQTDPESLASKINERFLELENNKKVSTADRIIISIPQNLLSSRLSSSSSSSSNSSIVRTDLPAVAESTNTSVSSLTLDSVTSGLLLNGTTGTVSNSGRAVESTENKGTNQQRTDTSIYYVSGSSSSVVSTVESDARTNVGPLGKFKLTKDFKASGTVPFALPTVVHDLAKKTNIRFDANFQISEDRRKFNFVAGTKVEDIIQNIILFSDYHEQIADQFKNIPGTGMIDWFRIETCVYIVEDKEEMKQSGRYPRVYVYRVVPYQISHSILKAPTASTVGLGNLKANAVKQYQYIYTGKNLDILEFNLEFNHAYYQALTANFGDTTAGERKLSSDNAQIEKVRSVDTAQASGYLPVEGAPSTHEVNNVGGISVGIPQKSAIQQATQDIHNSFLNSDTDLINLSLTILGDPYFIPDSGVGNFTGPNGANPNLKKTGSLNYQDGEVDINIIFKTPIDYNEQGTMDFIGSADQDGETVEGFSGLYRVITVTHLISSGLFTQKLELVRHKNQKEGTSSNAAVVSETDGNSTTPLAKASPTSIGTAGGGAGQRFGPTGGF